jgi:hypothetical protein
MSYMHHDPPGSVWRSEYSEYMVPQYLRGKHLAEILCTLHFIKGVPCVNDGPFIHIHDDTTVYSESMVHRGTCRADKGEKRRWVVLSYHLGKGTGRCCCPWQQKRRSGSIPHFVTLRSGRHVRDCWPSLKVGRVEGLRDLGKVVLAD